MAVTSFYLYPVGNFDAYNRYSQNFANVDDPQPISAHDSVATYDYLYGFSGSAQASGITYALGAPPAGVTINKIRVHGAFFISNAGADAFATDPEVTICVRPAGSATYYTAAATKVGGTGSVTGTARLTGLGFYNRNTASWSSGEAPCTAYWEFATNPATGVAWTLADLAALKVGFFCDGSKGTPYAGASVPVSSNSSYVACTALWVWVEAQTVAASIEAERTKGSQFLRMFRRPVRKARLMLPLEFADLDVGDTFVVDHPQGPHPGGAGWGKKDWQRREMILLSSSLNPTLRQVEVEALDAREFRCGIWSPLVTDIGFSEGGNGIPILHQGNPLTIPSTNYRVSTLYVKKQSADPTYAAAGAGKGLWTPGGLYVDNNYRFQALLNSTFSLGSGSTFTSWTNAGTGTFAEDTTNFLLDVDGYRRGAKLTCGTSQSPYLTQTSGTIGGSGWQGRVRIQLNYLTLATGASATNGSIYWYLQRSSDSYYWNDSSGAWQLAAVWNPLVLGNEATVGPQAFTSKMISLSTSTTYSLACGFLNATTGAVATFNEITFAYTDRQGSGAALLPPDEPILPTAAAATGAVRDYVYFPITRDEELREERGTLFLRWKPSFDHGDLPDGASKIVWLYRKNMGLEWMRAVYTRVSSTAASLKFQRYVAVADSTLGTTYEASVSLATTGDPTVASRSRTMSLAFRWTSASDELDLGARQMKVYVIPDASATGESTGGILKTGTATYADFTSRGITASDLGGMVSLYGNSLRRDASTAGWTSGFSTKTQDLRVTGAGGGMAFMPPMFTAATAARMAVGLDASDPNLSWDSIDFALYFNSDGGSNCQALVLENGVTQYTGGASSWCANGSGGIWYGGRIGRVQIEDVAGAPRARYYIPGLSGSTLYASTAVPTLPLYVDASLYDPTNAAIYGICLFGSAIAGTFPDRSTIEPSRLELGGWYGVDTLAETGAGAFSHLETTPYVLTDEEVERRMR